MAGIKAVALTAAEITGVTTLKTVLAIKPASGHNVKILGWGIFFQGTSVTADPVLVQACLQDGAGTGTDLVADTNLNRLDGESMALTTVGKHTLSVEPSNNRVLDTVYVHPQSGYEVRYPLGQEINVGSSVYGYFGLRVTAASAVDLVCKIFFEE